MQENLLRKKISKKKKNEVAQAEKQGKTHEMAQKSQTKNFLIEFEDDSETEEKLMKTAENLKEKLKKNEEKHKKTEKDLKKTEENLKISKSILKNVKIPDEAPSEIIEENEEIQPKSSRFNSLAICFPDSIIALHQVNP